MLRIGNINLPPGHSDANLRDAIAQALGIGTSELRSVRIRRQSIDARRKQAIVLTYTVDVATANDEAILSRTDHPVPVSWTPDEQYRFVATAPATGSDPARPIIVGMGPCGLFAGLMLARMGFRPLLLERGKKARERAKDVYAFWKAGTLNERSNVAFGEGGAGTFSDGKLTTRIKDRNHRCRWVLEELAHAGAPEEILYQANPHIGTDILIRVVEALRKTILSLGGEVRFESRVEDILIEGDAVRAVVLEGGERIDASQVMLAVGHSARDTFSMLHRRCVTMEAKAFSIGARIEHPQSWIDRAQFGSYAGHPDLGAAEYKLSHRAADGRGVYTFCMCPGGEVMAASSEAGGVVTNGMSRHARVAENANAAVLVSVTPDDLDGTGPLAGVEFQRQWEQRAFEIGGRNYRAPVQRVGDFLEGKATHTLGAVAPTYRPGVTYTDLALCLPPYAIAAMREGVQVFDRKIKGFAHPDAVLTGVETRSSSPVRILRGPSFESVNVAGLYPAGEGAGYAGGIMSAAVDGVKVAEAIAQRQTDTGPAQNRAAL